METESITTLQETQPLTAADVQEQLADLIRRLTQQLEQAAQEQAQRAQQLNTREEDLAARELNARARQLLAERELPEELALCLNFRDEASLKAGIDALEEAFRTAVQQGVENRLTQDAPKTGALKPLDQLSDEEYYAAVCRGN